MGLHGTAGQEALEWETPAFGAGPPQFCSAGLTDWEAEAVVAAAGKAGPPPPPPPPPCARPTCCSAKVQSPGTPQVVPYTIHA